MVKLQAEFVNQDEVNRALRKYGKDAEKAIGKAVQAQAMDVRSDIVRRIQRGPASGRVYYTGNVAHQASAPGEAPATDTGRLASSILYKKVNTLTADILSNVEYGPMLEFGTQRMQARPAWVPSVEAKRPDFVRRVTNAIKGLQ